MAEEGTIETDPNNDLAVLKIEVLDNQYSVLSFADSSDIVVGQCPPGNPFGLRLTLTTGIINCSRQNHRSQERKKDRRVIE